MFDFDAAVTAPFRMQPGLRKLAEGAQQLTPLQPGQRHYREKLAVLSAYAPLVLQAAAGFDAQPALAALCRHAAAEHPLAWAWDGQLANALALGVAVDGDTVLHTPDGRFGAAAEVADCLRQLPAGWRLAGLLSLAFAEDFAIVDAHSTQLPWLAVVLPSFWAPADKVGRPFAEVHQPVADGQLVVQAAAALTRLVTGPARWERFVWTITPHNRLHALPQHVAPDRWAGVPVQQAWWRTERQTFIPVPELAQAVFTIHVDVQPLQQALAAPGRAERLHAALHSMSDAVLDYRGLQGVQPALLRWLASLAEAPHSPVPAARA